MNQKFPKHFFRLNPTRLHGREKMGAWQRRQAGNQVSWLMILLHGSVSNVLGVRPGLPYLTAAALRGEPRKLDGDLPSQSKKGHVDLQTVSTWTGRAEAQNHEIRHASSGFEPAAHLLFLSRSFRFLRVSCRCCECSKVRSKGQQLCARPSHTSQLSESDNVCFFLPNQEVSPMCNELKALIEPSAD